MGGGVSENILETNKSQKVYRVSYKLPQEDDLTGLPITTLELLLQKNGLKMYGSKKVKIERLIGFLKEVTGLDVKSSMEITIETDRDFREDQEKVEIVKRGKVHSFLSLLSSVCVSELLSASASPAASSSVVAGSDSNTSSLSVGQKVCLPVFGQDYQEE